MDKIRTAFFRCLGIFFIVSPLTKTLNQLNEPLFPTPATWCQLPNETGPRGGKRAFRLAVLFSQKVTPKP